MAKIAKTEGEYYRRDGQKNVEICFFEEDFVLSDDVPSLELARCVIQNGLLSERLHKIDGYKRWRTCEVISFEDCGDSKVEISNIDKLLIRATELGCLPENIDNYKRMDFKVKALERAIANHESKRKAGAGEGYLEE